MHYVYNYRCSARRKSNGIERIKQSDLYTSILSLREDNYWGPAIICLGETSRYIQVSITADIAVLSVQTGKITTLERFIPHKNACTPKHLVYFLLIAKEGPFCPVIFGLK